MSHLVIKEFTHGQGKLAKVGEQVEMEKASGFTVNRLISKGFIVADPEESRKKVTVKVKDDSKNGVKVETKTEVIKEGNKKPGKKKDD